MNLVNFVTSNWEAITFVGSAIGGLIWHRDKKVKLDDLWDTLLKVGRQALPKLLNDPHLYDDAYVRSKLNETCWAGLERLGVKKNKAREKLVDEVVEHLHGELAEKLWDHHFGKAVSTLQQTASTLQATP